jgi:hypothetical protein
MGKIIAVGSRVVSRKSTGETGIPPRGITDIIFWPL